MKVKQNNLKQSGRSMVEMLGVLAIVGVLSIGGVVGYSHAIDKKSANEILNNVSLGYVIAHTQYFNKNAINLSELSSKSGISNTISGGILEAGMNGFYIQVNDVSQSVCDILKTTQYGTMMSVNDLYLGESSECSQDNIVYFVFKMNSGWCANFDAQGNCCDDNGRCCPLDKPLLNASGECVSCDGAINIDLGDNIAMCSRCENRSVLQGTTQCSKKCVEGEFRQNNGVCRTCDNLKATGSYIENVPENVERVFGCETAMISDYYGGIYAVDCEANVQSVGLAGHIDTCNRCENRMIVYNNYCAKICPDGEFYPYHGECVNCDNVGSWWLDDSPQNRAMVREKVLACPKMLLMDAAGFQATHCDHTTKSVDVTGATHTCAKCPNRRLEGNRCVLIEE